MFPVKFGMPVRAQPVATSAASFAQKTASLATAMAVISAAGPSQAASAGFLNLKDNATVSSPVHIDFTVSGYEVAPAAEGLKDKSGHFHLIVDAEDFIEEGIAIKFDEAHLHYGKGQTSVDVPLAPGKHKLVVQFANALHESYGPELARKITVNVQ